MMSWKTEVVLLLVFLWYAEFGQTHDDDVIAFPRTEVGRVQEELASAINSFGYRLMRESMKQNENQNIIISPTGVASLLAMTLLGTVGQTYNEIADALGFSRDILKNRKNHEHFGDLLKMLNTNDTFSKTLFADAVFADEHAQLRDAYRSYLSRIYDGGAFAVDFADRSTVKQTINEWVKKHTEGKIDDFLDEPLPIETKVVLLTALYFSGQWAHPFMAEYTLEMPFHTPVGDVMADLMLNTGNFKHHLSLTYGLQMIALPYNDSTVMYALKPLKHKNISLAEVMNILDYQKIDDMIKQMRLSECVIRFPKMNIKNSLDLRKDLQAMGMQSMFIPQQANFALMMDSNVIANNTEEELISRINDRDGEIKDVQEMLNNLPNPGVHVDVVKHDVKLTVNEYGTEAIAVSAAFLARTADLFYVDSPFYMFIRNEKTKLVTFSAVIYDPTKS